MLTSLVSIIMPAYNCEKYITEAIASVINQTYQNWELIVIDDCSQDNTVNIVKRLALEDTRINLYQNERNVGVSKTRNKGLSIAKGQWIAFLDSDDCWASEKLEKQMEFIKAHPNALLTYTASKFMDTQGNRYSYIMHAEKCVDYHAILRKNLISCSSVIVDRSLMISVGMVNDDITEDHATWLKILQKIPYAYGVDDPLLIYRISKTSRSGARLRAARRQYGCYRYIGKNILSAAMLTALYAFYSIQKRRKIRNS